MPYGLRINKLMDAPAHQLRQGFIRNDEPIIRQPLPTPLPAKRMTYDEAYDEASIACWEIMGTPHSRDWGDLHEKLLDDLCIKHNIE